MAATYTEQATISLHHISVDISNHDRVTTATRWLREGVVLLLRCRIRRRYGERWLCGDIPLGVARCTLDVVVLSRLTFPLRKPETEGRVNDESFIYPQGKGHEQLCTEEEERNGDQK